MSGGGVEGGEPAVSTISPALPQHLLVELARSLSCGFLWRRWILSCASSQWPYFVLALEYKTLLVELHLYCPCCEWFG
jgi:hypothetical protein